METSPVLVKVTTTKFCARYWRSFNGNFNEFFKEITSDSSTEALALAKVHAKELNERKEKQEWGPWGPYPVRYSLIELTQGGVSHWRSWEP